MKTLDKQGALALLDNLLDHTPPCGELILKLHIHDQAIERIDVQQCMTLETSHECVND